MSRSNPSAYSYLFKYIIIGDSGVGKSCLLLQFTSNTFTPIHDLTIGVEFGSKIVHVPTEYGGENCKIQVWDTAGQESFRSITKSYYRGSVGVVIVFDVTRRNTFEHIPTWLEDARKYASPSSVILIVGNKADMPDRQVTDEEAILYVKKEKLLYLETSAKNGVNVEELFTMLARSILDKIGLNKPRNELNDEDIRRLEEQGVKCGPMVRSANDPNTTVTLNEQEDGGFCGC